MNNISDQLIQEAQCGDIGAFEEIYGLTSGFVYAVSYRITGSRMDAEEAAQDVFVKLYDNLKKYREGTSFKAWIYRITVNTSINYYNKSKKRKNVHGGDFEVASETVGTGSQIEANIDKEDADMKINLILDNLNMDQRTCIILREIEGLSYEEISRALSVNINTVRTRLKRAREVLLKCTDKKEIRDEV